MSIIILFICFVLILLSLHVLLSGKLNTREIVLTSVISFSTILVIITEISSALHSLNYSFILSCWSVIAILNIFFLISKKDRVKSISRQLFSINKASFKNSTKLEKAAILTTVFILLLIFIQGIVYPSNNWDSMTYHLSRSINWISHGAVEHYPTHILRQLYQPPFSEFVLTHFNILNNGDYFSNAIQFFFLVFSLIAVVSITDLMGLNRRQKLIAILLTITIPELVLQASSTQNDIIVSFFILTTTYFAFKAIKQNHFYNYLFFGLSIGLAFLTKATAYIYLAPILIVFLIALLIKLKKSKNGTQFIYSFIIFIVVLGINLGHYYRNFKVSGNIIGVDKTEMNLYTNEEMSVNYFASNLIKNAGLHIAPSPFSEASNNAIEKIHSFINVDINDKKINFNQSKHSEAYNIQNHEDYAPNTIHFILIILSIILISIKLIKNKNGLNKTTLYVLVILSQIILFSFFLKWQPWHTRLHTPVFILSIPLICIAASNFNTFQKGIQKLIPVLMIAAIFLVVFNYSRPYISSSFTSDISITDARQKKYFANRLDVYSEYSTVIQKINNSKNQNIGLVLGGDDWEYPLFSSSYQKNLNPIHIKVPNMSKKLYLDKKIDCIVSTVINDTIIKYQGKKYYNQSHMNDVIWFYK